VADEVLSTRSYVYTFVNKFGEEGPPSPASREITVGQNAGVVISLVHAEVATRFGIVSKRLYRAVSGEESVGFRLVAEVPLATTTIADTKRDDELGEELPSADWDMPPQDLVGIVSLSGGMLAGFRRGTGILCITYPDQVHAWPIKYRIRFDFPIVGIMPLDMGFVVFTEAETYFVAGTVPEQFQVRNCPSAPRCIGRKSIASTGPVGYYASALGPVQTDGMTFRYLLETTNSTTDPTRVYAGHINETLATDTAAWGTAGAEDVRREAASFAAVTDGRLFQSFFYDATPTGGDPGTAWTFSMYEYDLVSRSYPFLCGRWEWVADITDDADQELKATHVGFDKLTRTLYTLRGAYPTANLQLARLFPRASATELPSNAVWNSKEFTLQRPFHPGVMYVDFSYSGPTSGGPELLTKVRVEVIALIGDDEHVVADESFTHDPGQGSLASPHNWVRRVRVVAGPRSHRIKLRVTLPSGYPVSVRRVIVAENMQELIEKLPSA
jgi:hypothetical protein